MGLGKTAVFLALAAGTALAPSLAQAWTKSYLVNWMAPAFYYGGPPTGGEETLAPDCPTGINPAVDWHQVLVTPYRPKQEVERILNPEHRGQGGAYYEHFGFRGPNGTNVYENPASVPDPGFIEVTGKIAVGFDLDDNPETGFTSPEGVKGIDNAYYKAAGCVSSFRHVRYQALYFKQANDRMRDGYQTAVMVISGEKDPMNDDNVTIGFYGTSDIIVKDANGAPTPDMTFRVDPKNQSIFKGKITNGVIEAVDRPEISIALQVRGQPGMSTLLHKGKMKLETQADGTVRGLIGGYREANRFYAEMGAYGNTGGGGTAEQLSHMSLPGFWYSLRRNADSLPDPKTGVKMGLSVAYDLELIPAFVMTPDNSEPVTVARNFTK